MSPRVSAGKEDEIRGTSGKLEVVADRLADEVLEAQEWRPEAVRVVFKLKGDSTKEVSWAIPIAQPDLRPFTSNKPQGGPALRRAINGMLDSRPRWADVYNGFIRRWLAPPGDKYIGTLDDIRQGISKKDGKVWWFIRLRTKEGLTAEFPAGWPDIQTKVGTTPIEDWAGPRDEFNEGKSPFYYLCQLGLDWDHWTNVELEEAPALFEGHFDDNMNPIKPYFADREDWSLTMLEVCRDHGLTPVQFKTEIHPQHGLSIIKGRIWFELTPVVVEGTPEDESFRAARDVFVELWENFSRVLLEKPGLQFLIAEGDDQGKPTEHAKIVIRGALVPLIRKYPDTVKLFRDGVPKAGFPIKREDWRTNGLAALSFVAERLMKEQELFQIVNLDRPDSMLAWAEENVEELRSDMTVDEGEEF